MERTVKIVEKFYVNLSSSDGRYGIVYLGPFDSHEIALQAGSDNLFENLPKVSGGSFFIEKRFEIEVQ